MASRPTNYLAFLGARLAEKALRTRVLAVLALPAARARTAAADGVAFGRVQARAAIAAIRAPFVLRARCTPKE